MKRIEEKKKKVKRKKEQEVQNFKDYQKFCEYIHQDLDEFKKQKPWEDIKL